MSESASINPSLSHAPTPMRGQPVKRSIITGLAGRRFEGDWFSTTLDERMNFWAATRLDQAYGQFDDAYIPGFFLLSLLDSSANKVLRGILPAELVNYGFDRVRFTAMTFPQDEIRFACTVSSVEPRSSGLVISKDCQLDLKRGVSALVARWLIFVPTSKMEGD